MNFQSSPREVLSLIYVFLQSVMDPHRDTVFSSTPTQVVASSSTISHTSASQDQAALITTAPELRLRDAVPEPQNGNTCSQAEQSASQAIQQASQQASQSIQQASQQAAQLIQQAQQQASQAAQSAARSASQAIQEASIQASNSIAAASRSVTSAMTSASFAIASIQSSADQAISRANGSMFSAQASATAAQVDASEAVVQLQAAVAAATGSAAAAGKSFLSAAAKATEGAQASISAFGAQASSQVSQASSQATVSQTVAITATEAALAIVGSIIASALITILIYFLLARHKKNAERRSFNRRDVDYSGDPQLPRTGTGGTAASSRSKFDPKQNDFQNGPQVSFSLAVPPSSTATTNMQKSDVKTTTVKWDPKNPPKAPILGSWLKLNEAVSPFGSIALPDVKTPSPLGGQLKSPLQSSNTPVQRKPSPRQASTQHETAVQSTTKPVAIRKPPLAPSLAPEEIPKEKMSMAPRTPVAITITNPQHSQQQSMSAVVYRESGASIWVDDIPDQSPSFPPLQSPPPPQLRSDSFQKRAPPPPSRGPISSSSQMQIPEPVNPVRNTADWLKSHLDKEQQALAGARDLLMRNPSQNQNQNQNQDRGQSQSQDRIRSQDSKENPSPSPARRTRRRSIGLPSHAGPSSEAIENNEMPPDHLGNVAYVESIASTAEHRKSVERMRRARVSSREQRELWTLGVGKAM